MEKLQQRQSKAALATDRGRSGPQRTDTEIRSVTDRGRSGPQRTDTEIL